MGSDLENLLLSLVIVAGMILCIYVCTMILCSSAEPGLKLVSAYTGAILLLYQLSTVLAYFSPVSLFEPFMTVKIISAFLLKTVFLLYMAIFIKNSLLIRIFLAVHLVSLAFILPPFVIPGYKASIFTVTGHNSAVYASGAHIYSLISNLLYIASALTFFIIHRPFREKKRHLVFLLLLFSSNIAILFYLTDVSYDAVHEKMHVLLLFVLAAFIFKFTPFFEKRDALLSASSITDGISETVVIIDALGRDEFIHTTPGSPELKERISEIKSLVGLDTLKNTLTQAGGLNNADSCIEGKLALSSEKTCHFAYRISPLFSKGICKGAIIVLRDITAYIKLHDDMNQKNLELREAFEKLKQYVRITRRLAGEEERSRILGIVNKTAGEYISKIKMQINELENRKAANSLTKEAVRVENEQLLILTRKVIDEIRNTVKTLNTNRRTDYDKGADCR